MLAFAEVCALWVLYTRRGIITGPLSFRRHNLVSVRFIYTKILDNIVEGMLSLQIWKQLVFWLNVCC